MWSDEIIVCSQCKGEDCRVDELREKRKVSMEEFIERHTFTADIFNRFWKDKKVERRFVITCQDCGYQKEFRERIVESPIIRMKEEHDGT